MIGILSVDPITDTGTQLLKHCFRQFNQQVNIYTKGTEVIEAIREGTIDKVFTLGAESFRVFSPKTRKVSDCRLKQHWISWLNCPLYYSDHLNTVLKTPDKFTNLANDILFCCKTPATQMQRQAIPDYYFVDNEQFLAACMRDLVSLKPEYVVVDIETSGFNYIEDFVRLVGIAATPYRIYIIYAKLLEKPKCAELVATILQEQKIVGHNFNQFDAVFMRETFKIDVKVTFDTMLLSYTLDETSGGHSLDNLAAIELLVQSWKDMIPDYATAPIKQLADYLALDLSNNYQIVKPLNDEVQNEGKLEQVNDNILLPCAFMLGKVQYTGIKLDLEYLRDLDGKHEKKSLNLVMN